MKYAMLSLVFLSLLLVTSACTQSTPVQNPPFGESSQLQSFSSQAEFDAFFTRTSSNHYYRGNGGMGFDDVMVRSESAPMAADGSLDKSFTDTNVQVPGIDEPDFVKTDGVYLYVLNNNRLFIFTADEDLDQLSEFEFGENTQARELLLDGDSLLIIATQYRQNQRYFSGSETVVLKYDVADRASPVLDDELSVQGDFLQARTRAGTFYLVTSQYGGSSVSPPIILYEDKRIAVPVDDIYYFPYPHNSPVLNTVLATPIEDFSSQDVLSVVTESSNTLYMSDESIFLVSQEYVNEWDIRQDVTISLVESALSSSQQSRVSKIRNADPDVLSEDEKRSKIMQVINEYMSDLPSEEQKALDDQIERAFASRMGQYDYLHYSLLTRVSIDGSLEVASDGRVPGRINNQFSLDERDGVLRIATTIDERRDYVADEQVPSQSHVYTLGEDLEVLDSVSGLGKDEQIYSTRFIDDRLYLVTFRQTDPFFVVDLSDASDISVLGELKIPGFSRYLHPFDNNTIIGVGQDADNDGRTRGVKVSLFDVSDTSKPVEQATYLVKSQYSSSSAEFDHHAFVFQPSSGLLLLPVNSYDDEPSSGLHVLELSSDSIKEVGVIQHEKTDRYSYRASIERSVIVDDLILTISHQQVQANALPALNTLEVVEFPEVEYDRYPVEPFPIFR